MDDFIVAVRSGSTYSLRTTFDQYVRVKPFEVMSELPSGRYRMVARFIGDGARTTNGAMQGVALLNFWKGTLHPTQSNSSWPADGYAYSPGRYLMTTFRRVVQLGLVGVLAGVTMTTTTRAEVSCHKINAKGVGQDLGGGQTQAQIVGGGLLHGTTVGNFAITGISGTVASFVGTVTFTTNQTTLTVTVAGTLDVATGEFSAAGPVTGATGKLAGATGNLTLEGVEDLSTGTFVEDVTGEICVDLAPDGV